MPPVSCMAVVGGLNGGGPPAHRHEGDLTQCVLVDITYAHHAVAVFLRHPMRVLKRTTRRLQCVHSEHLLSFTLSN